MKIRKIKKLKNGKYKLELDNDDITLFDEVILENNLLFHKEIDDDLLIKLTQDNCYYESYNKIVKYILCKMRSEKQIIEYMDKLNVRDEDKDKILIKLKQNNLINDNAYLKAFIADKINLTNDGPYKIKEELLKQNINEALIIEELQNYPEEIFSQKIEKIVNKKINSNNKYSSYNLKQKILLNLINMGYSKESILPFLENIKSNNNIIEKEYHGLYRKLSKKYSDDKLYYEIRNRLFRKGFSSEDIAEVIEKSE